MLLCGAVLFAQPYLLLHTFSIHVLGMNPLAAPNVTLSFQNQGLVLMKHERSHTGNEPFGCSHCDLEFSKSRATVKGHKFSETCSKLTPNFMFLVVFVITKN